MESPFTIETPDGKDGTKKIPPTVKEMKMAKNRTIKTKFDFSGVVTALVTPFKKGRLDLPSVRRLVRHQLDSGVQGFVINGTTGESPTLSADEVKTLFSYVKKVSDHSVPLILGTGSNSTTETVKKTKAAAQMKADAALVVVPYYNKPPQRGLVAHYTEVAKASRVPILLYNVPGRTIVSLSVETILRLAQVKNIHGIKEASGNLDVAARIVSGAPKSFLLTSGDDGTCIDFMNAGGRGVISVISHVIPKELRALSDRALRGERVGTEYVSKYKELNELLSLEANPIPVKTMLHLMGLIDSPELRLPLIALDGENRLRVQSGLKKLGLI